MFEIQPAIDPFAGTLPLPVPFRCERRRAGALIARVALSGELDVAAFAEADAAIREAEGDATVVVIDLDGVTFIDSTGVHLILRADERARLRGHRLPVVLCSEPVRRLFTATGIYRPGISDAGEVVGLAGPRLAYHA